MIARHQHDGHRLRMQGCDQRIRLSRAEGEGWSALRWPPQPREASDGLIGDREPMLRRPAGGVFARLGLGELGEWHQAPPRRIRDARSPEAAAEIARIGDVLCDLLRRTLNLGREAPAHQAKATLTLVRNDDGCVIARVDIVLPGRVAGESGPEQPGDFCGCRPDTEQVAHGVLLELALILENRLGRNGNAP